MLSLIWLNADLILLITKPCTFYMSTVVCQAQAHLLITVLGPVLGLEPSVLVNISADLSLSWLTGDSCDFSAVSFIALAY